MANFEFEEKVNASPERVFEVLSDLPNSSSYLENVKKTVKVSDGPMGVGTVFEETRIVNGKEATASLEVRQYEPPRLFAIGNETEGIDVTYIYTLEKENAGTRIRWEAELSASGLKRMMVPMVAGILKKEDKDHLLMLKKAVEA